jgi:hypothetical protein
MAIHDQGQLRVPASRISWLMILFPLVLGFLTIAFAVDESFARGRVVFDHERWRIAFGLVGAYLTYRAARAFVRTINRASVELGREQVRRSRQHGLVLLAIGAGFLLCVLNEVVGDHSVEFRSWARSLYVAGGIYLLLMGAIAMIDIAGYRQRQQELAERIREHRGAYDD